MPPQRRTIRLFVSSTFADMVAERDLLQREVFPKLRLHCQKRGLEFQPIDLRWGVSEEASRHNRTMRICLKELARCQEGRLKPNFLILLGERYGWRPLPETVPAELFERLRPAAEARSAPAARGLRWYRLDQNADPPAYVLLPREKELTDYNLWCEQVETPLVAALESACARILAEGTLGPVDRMRLEELGIGKSATHQEIVHGALRVADAANHVHAFSRRWVGGVRTRQPRLAALETEIESAIGRSNIHPYTVADTAERLSDAALSEFQAEALKALEAVIDREAERLRTAPAIEEERDLHRHLGKQRRTGFRGRKHELELIAGNLNGGSERPLVVLGESGVGKSAVMAQAAEQARTLHFTVVERYVGASPRSTSVLTLLRDVAEEIRRAPIETRSEAADEPANLRSTTEALRRAMEATDPERPLALFLDGLDQLGEDSYGRKLNWLPNRLPKHVRLVVSCTMPSANADPTDPRHEVFHAVSAKIEPENCVVVGRLTEQEGDALLDDWLREVGRVVQAAQRKAVLGAFARNGNALWLRVAAAEAARMPSWAEPPELPPTLVELMAHMLSRMAGPLEHGRKLVERTVGYLAAARRGLSESELFRLLSDDVEVMEEFRRRFPKAPAADQLPAAVWAALRGDLDPYLSESEQYGATLLAFAQASIRDSVIGGGDLRDLHRALAGYFLRQPANQRTMDELPWQLVQAEDWDALAELLSDPKRFSALFGLNRSDAKSYWTRLERNSTHKMPQVFAEVIRNPSAFPEAALAVSDLLDETAYPDEARQLLERLIGQYPAEAPMEGYVACLNRLGLLQMQAGQYEQCEETFRNCRHIGRLIGSRWMQGTALLNLAIAQRAQGRFDRAETLLDAFLEDEYDMGLGRAYLTKALIAEARSQQAAAEDWLNRALKQAEEEGDDGLRNEILESRAALLTGEGRVPEGQYDLSQAAQHFDRIGDLNSSASTRLQIGVLEKDRGNLAAAIEQYERAAEFERRLGRSKDLAMALDNQAEALIRMRRFDEALPLNLEAVRIFRQYNATRHLAIALLNQSTLKRGTGDTAAAEAAMAEARSLSREAGDADTAARTLLLEAGTRADEGKYVEAEQAARQAIQALASAGVQDALAQAHGLLGLLMAEHLGRPVEALEEFDAAVDIGTRRDLRSWVIDLLRRICWIYSQRGEDQVVVDAAGELARQAARHQDALAAMFAALFRSDALSRLRNFAEACEAAEKGVAEAQRMGNGGMLAVARLTLAMRRRDCGEAAASVDEAQQAESLYATAGNWDGVVQSRIVRAQTLVFDLDRDGEAAEVVAGAIELDRTRNEARRSQSLELVQQAIRTRQSRNHGGKP